MNEQEEIPSTSEPETFEPLETTTTSFVQPKSSHKWEKQLQQTLKDLRPDEIGKTDARSSYKARLVAQSNVVDNIESIDELNLASDFEPTSYFEAKDGEVWRQAMQDGYDALIKNGTWELIDPPLGCKPMGCKWIF